MNIKTFLYSITILALAGMPRLLLAQDSLVPCVGDRPCTFGDLFKLGTNVLNFIFGLVAVLTFFSISISGFLFVTSGSNEGRRGQAKDILLWSVLGFILAIAAYAIVVFIQETLGVTDGFGI